MSQHRKRIENEKIDDGNSKLAVCTKETEHKINFDLTNPIDRE